MPNVKHTECFYLANRLNFFSAEINDHQLIFQNTYLYTYSVTKVVSLVLFIILNVEILESKKLCKPLYFVHTSVGQHFVIKH